MEFDENDLENVVGGMPYDQAIEIAKEHPELFRQGKKELHEDRELTEEELENIRAGYPYPLEEEDRPKTR